MYDVVVVGAGPAGATVARLAGERHRTLLVERRVEEPRGAGSRQGKCCGGLLAPDAQRALASLGLGVPREVLSGPQLFAVRALDAPSGLVRHYARPYLNVDRGRLDAWLRSLVPPAVEVLRGARAIALRDEDGAIALDLDVAGGRRTVRARLVVGADGAGSAVRRLAFPGAPAPASAVAIQEWFEAAAPDPCYTVLFDPALTGLYAWAIPKGDRLVLGAALPPGAGAPARFEAIVEAFHAAGLRPGRSLGREGTLLDLPARPREVLAGGGRVALVGEAAGLVSPSSAEGISFALRSGAALAAALAPGIDGWEARHRAGIARLRRVVAGKLAKRPALYHPALRRLVLASGIGSVTVGAPPTLATAPAPG
jgi:flavin-dependent dehydrogenase